MDDGVYIIGANRNECMLACVVNSDIKWKFVNLCGQMVGMSIDEAQRHGIQPEDK